MRIVSGLYGGRRLNVPKGRDIRPTSDKVRGAIFNALRSRGAVDGARVLDAFCGTGALGLEALSQGAAHCTFMDNAKDSLALARENAAALKAENCTFVFKDAAKIAARSESEAAYNLVFLDPPYNRDLIAPVLGVLDQGRWLAAGAVCVIEAEKSFAFSPPKNFEMLDERSYGETKIITLRYESVPE